MDSRALLRCNVLRVRSDARARGEAPVDELDTVAVEAPLEIRVAGDPVAVTMRTPGDDPRLALGFLFAEGILRSAADAGTLRHCGRTDEASYGNALDVLPAGGVHLDLERVQATRRGTLTTSACGVCGRQSIEDLLRLCGKLPEDGLRVPYALIAGAPEALRAHQLIFRHTGGLHAAAALDLQGNVLAAFEDVGRHNAVDKVVGELLLKGLVGRGASLSPAQVPVLLAVSGRASFEILQKAAMARFRVVASVSAASSLAVAVAVETGITLASFVRDGNFNVHAHANRLF